MRVLRAQSLSMNVLMALSPSVNVLKALSSRPSVNAMRALSLSPSHLRLRLPRALLCRWNVNGYSAGSRQLVGKRMAGR